MIFTEEEAKARTCCKPSGKMIADNGPCIGSACMAWRWKTDSRLIDLGDGESKWEYHRANFGHCGFAGVPTTVTHINGAPVEYFPPQERGQQNEGAES